MTHYSLTNNFNIFSIFQLINGENCLIHEPIYNTTFNLNGLRSDFERVIKTGLNDEIKFNLCGNISKKCGGKTNVSACFITHDKKEFILGNKKKKIKLFLNFFLKNFLL